MDESKPLNETMLSLQSCAERMLHYPRYEREVVIERWRTGVADEALNLGVSGEAADKIAENLEVFLRSMINLIEQNGGAAGGTA